MNRITNFYVKNLTFIMNQTKSYSDMDFNISNSCYFYSIFIYKYMQECRNGILTEKKLRKIYADIFPMVSLTITQNFLAAGLIHNKKSTQQLSRNNSFLKFNWRH